MRIPPVPTVDQQFRALVTGNLTAGVYSFLLSAVNRGGPLATSGSDRPTVLVRHDVLIALSHRKLLIYAHSYPRRALPKGVDRLDPMVYDYNI